MGYLRGPRGWSRRHLLALLLTTAAALPVSAGVHPVERLLTMERPPALPADLVREFVLKAHGDLARVQALLAEQPALLNATWDWGGGDFESALGAAAHTGQREIALHLLAHGARLDLFAAAMLGHLSIVKAMLEAFPALLDSRGAHGIPLLVHAQQGGEAARPVLEYLQTLRG
jgi:hypothetical protein